MSRPTPLYVTHEGDQVVVRVDAATARRLAEAWAHFHSTSPTPVTHLRWHDDVVRLLTAAIKVDDNVPVPVLVPMVGSNRPDRALEGCETR